MSIAPRHRQSFLVAMLIAVLATALASTQPSSARADIFTRILTSVERAGGKAVMSGARQLDHAASLARKIDLPNDGAAIAGHVGIEGHWTFVNKAGEHFTAGTPEEIARVIPTLAPKVGEATSGKLVLVLSEDAVLRYPENLKHLPKGVELRIAGSNEAIPLTIEVTGTRLVHVRPNVAVVVADQIAYREVMWQLARPLRKSDMRVLSLDPAGPTTLSSVPRMEPGTGRALTDRIAPDHLDRALHSLAGQTAVVTGRIDGGRLIFRAGDAKEHALSIDAVKRAAGSANVNLLVLDTPVPRQPGVRNWLWRPAEVKGLDAALGKATIGDFLGAVAGGGNTMLRVNATVSESGRLLFRAEPAKQSIPLPDFGLGKMMAEVVAEVAGQVVMTAASGDFQSSETQRDYDMRIIPGIPSDYQLAYILSAIVGIMGLPVVLGWWRRLWPPERREDYSGVLGYRLAGLAKAMIFLVVFLPIAGGPAFLVSLAQQGIGILLLPVRIVSWLIRRLTPRRA